MCQVLCEAQGHREYDSGPAVRPVLLGDHSLRGVTVPRGCAQGGLPRLKGDPMGSLCTMMSEAPSNSGIRGLCPVP